ncbi:sensor histidine kinase [Streptosporangium sp. NPDC050855]|uniref:sensor histidine kinase n=1 Tax=Streptosporangium sp. NPDC050855 TaxID=3366194 RepID=UPI0037B8BD6D
MAGSAPDRRRPSSPRRLTGLLPWHRGMFEGAAADVWAPPMGLSLSVAVLCGYVLMTLINLLSGLWTFPEGFEPLGFALFGGVFALQLAHSSRQPRRWPVRRRALTLSAQALATYLPYAWFGPPWSVLGGFLAAAVLQTLGTVASRWALYLLVGVTFPLVALADGVPLPDAAQLAGVTLQTGLVIYGVSALSGVVAEVHAARRDVARMAVVRERLRVARDLHDLFGYHLSAMALKGELACRLLPRFADRARTELKEVLDIARRALADVRVVAGGYRDISLREEVRTAVSTLSSAGIDVRVSVPPRAPAGETGAVMAIVLREAVTNTLRHSRARRCVIEVAHDDGTGEIGESGQMRGTEDAGSAGSAGEGGEADGAGKADGAGAGGTVRLRVTNDGVVAVPEAASQGSGLGNLACRLEDVGGGLTVTTSGEWFELVAEAPAAPAAPAGSAGTTGASGAARTAGTAGTSGTSGTRRGPRGPVWPLHRYGTRENRSETQALRMAMLLTFGMLGGYTLLTVVNVLRLAPDRGASLASVPCLLAVLALQVAHSVYRPRRWPRRIRALTLSALTLATFLPLLWLGAAWESMAGFLAGSVLLVVTGWARWVLYAAVGAAVLAVSALWGHEPALIGYVTVSSLLTGLVVFGVSSLSGLVDQVHAARGQVTRMAVERERLRVARDLHEVLGRNLSEVTMRSELARRFLPESPERAREEAREIASIARRALSDVRVAASGYRDMSLAAEAETAAASLSSAGIDVSLDVRCGTPPRELDTMMAIVLHETVTNVLRHSRARRCAIEASADRDALRLRVSNDRARDGEPPDLAGAGAEDDSGLGDLRARLEGVGGRLTALVRDGRFEVTAEVPLSAGRTGGAGGADAGLRTASASQAPRAVPPATVRTLRASVDEEP